MVGLHAKNDIFGGCRKVLRGVLQSQEKSVRIRGIGKPTLKQYQGFKFRRKDGFYLFNNLSQEQMGPRQ